MAGRIDIMFDQVSEAMQRLRDSAINAYAVTDKKRLVSLADIPTVDEAGLPGTARPATRAVAQMPSAQKSGLAATGI